MKRFFPQTLILMAVLGALTAFQNCSDSSFSGVTTGASKAPAEGSLQAQPVEGSTPPPASTSPFDPAPAEISTDDTAPTPPPYTIPTATPMPTPLPPGPTPTPAPSVAQVPAQSQVYNFGSGDAALCASSVREKLGITTTCTFGGGCTFDGEVPSPGHPSANPGVFGACFHGQTPASPTDTFQRNFNFVAADLATCQNLVPLKLGLRNVTCAISGGCAVDGRPPSSGNPSANPNQYGVCVPMSFR